MRRVAPTLIAALMVIYFAGAASAQPAGEVRRLRGIIDKDETWTGTILITDDLTIDGATVRVMPGTVIEFAGGDPRRRPILTVGAEVRTVRMIRPDSVASPKAGAIDPLQGAGRLEMTGSGERPIIVRTEAKSGSGRLVVTVRNKIVTSRLEQGTVKKKITTTQAADQLNWRHVRFERLGSVEPQRASQRDVDVSQPGVQILIRQGGQEVSLENCSFTDCSQLLIQTDAECDVRVQSCRFENSIDSSSLKLLALDVRNIAKSLRIIDNVASAMIVVSAGPAELTGNRIIGPCAAIAVRQDAIGDIRVESNYVHCTEQSDNGRYVLTVERPDTVVKDNVLIGGTHVVHQGSRRMTGNVLVAAPRLANDRGGKSRTHRLVASLPKGASFEGNVLIGPAFALVGAQQSLMPARSAAQASQADDKSGEAGATQIKRNVFDGVDGQTTAVQLSLPRTAGGAIEVFDNVVLRCGPVVSDSTQQADALDFADYNAVIGGPERLFQRANVAGRREGEDSWSKHDLRHATADLVGLATPPVGPPDLDADVASGAMSVQDARHRLIEPYRPRSGSTLVGAGRPQGDPPKPGTIGLSTATQK